MRFKEPLLLALAAMLLQQSFTTMSRNVVPLVAPVAVKALDISPALVGVYAAIASGAAIVTTLGCGGFILRYGALRMSQTGLLLMSAGLAGGATGLLPLLAAAGVPLGVGSAVATPSSSHLLARFSPPRYAPLIFSIKQTGVPAGLMMAGILTPFLVGLVGWQGALAAMAALCVATALLLQPLRARFDDDRDPGRKPSPADIRATLAAVLSDPRLRALALACFAFVGLQSAFSNFLVLSLTEGLGYGLTTAGSIFALAMAVAVPARILWGWAGSRYTTPRRLLALLGVTMAAAATVAALFTPAWPLPAVAAVAIVLSATAVSWHGVLLAEVARLAPPGKVGATTGGVLSFGDMGSAAMPLLFGGILAATGSYGWGFAAAALAPLAAGLTLLRRGGRD